MKGFMMFLLVGLISVSVRAQVPVVETEEVSGGVSLGVQSKYLDPRSGAIYTDGPVAQDEVTVSMLGFDFNIWHNASLERRAGKTDGDEIDYTISRTFEGQRGSLEVGISYYDFAKLCNGRQDNAYAGYAELVISAKEPVGKVFMADYVRLESVLTTPGSDFEGGTFITVGGRMAADFFFGSKLLGDASLTRNDGVYGLEPDTVFTYNLSVEADKWGWTFSPNFTLTAPFHGESQTAFGFSASREF